MHRRLFWALLLLTLAVYGVMLLWSLPTVSRAAGGLAPFDMRPNGYSFAEAEAFLAALSKEGLEFYQEVQQRLDLVYPALISLTLLFAIVGSMPRWIGAWRWGAVLLTLPIAGFDYLENHAVASMLELGAAGLTPQLVEQASQCTVLKASFTTFSMSILVFLLLAKVVGSLRRRLEPKTISATQ
jgi:hypothetical protein